MACYFNYFHYNTMLWNKCVLIFKEKTYISSRNVIIKHFGKFKSILSPSQDPKKHPFYWLVSETLKSLLWSWKNWVITDLVQEANICCNCCFLSNQHNLKNNLFSQVPFSFHNIFPKTNFFFFFYFLILITQN